METAKTTGIINSTVSVSIMEYFAEYSRILIMGFENLSALEYFQFVQKTLTIYLVLKKDVSKEELKDVEKKAVLVYNQIIEGKEIAKGNRIEYVVGKQEGNRVYKLRKPNEDLKWTMQKEFSKYIPNQELTKTMGAILTNIAINKNIIGYMQEIRPPLDIGDEQ